MNGDRPADAEHFMAWCEERGVHTVVVGTSDTHGSWIGKRVAVRELPALLRGEGLAFSDVLFAITRDGNNVVEPPATCATYFPRKDNGYPDIFLRPDPSTARLLPWHDGTAAVNGEFVLPDHTPVPIAPRNVLVAQVKRARALGLQVRIGFEFEFYLLRGSLAELADGGYELRPLSARPYTYMVFRSSVDAPLLRRIRDGLEGAGIAIEGLNPETGPGQYEINTRFSEALRAGDDAFLYKNAIKELAAAEGLVATFMAKPRTDWAGSSCHLHQSLWRLDDGAALMWSQDGPLSRAGRQYVAGLLATMADFAALFAPTVNAYKRLVPYSWAATTASWGLDNRSTGLRVVGDGPRTRRVEHRLGGADVNPYLAIAACLAGGLHGMENGLEPGEPYGGDAYADDGLPRLPATFAEALDRLEASDLARNAFGDAFVEHFVAMKRWEVEQYRGQVSDWEVRHYVETA
ncbi:glutamine synthetase family protein [Thermopolyspora sp. NPDC052614]|uniref:glutamine synthetase family protein n=1 Tax=Thermopolyspora sp. NPDC052614 TaxID=3155682 RepID=UPI003439F467